MKLLKAASIAATCLIFSASASANFVNAGFETGDFTGWTVGGVNGVVGVAADKTPVPEGYFQPAFVSVHSGEFAAYGATAQWDNEFYSLSQSINLNAGSHTAGFFLGHDDNSIIGIDNAIDKGILAIFVNGVAQSFTLRSSGNNFDNGSTPASMQEFAAQFESTAGLALIEFRISGSGTGRTVLSADDFYVTGTAPAVPEPANWALVAAGLAMLGARLRFSRR